MTSRPGKPLCDRTMQLSIKQVVDAGFDTGRGIVHIAEPQPGKYFPAWVDGHGDHVTITVYAGWGNTIESVVLSETPCHFGGSRKWFDCPECGRRCGVLYVTRKGIACRTCSDLAYESQYEAPRDRMRRQLRKIRKVIGTGMELGNPFSPPPKGMSIARWKALIEEYIELREKYYRESEKPRKWRNDAPSADHWKLKGRVPASRLN